MKRITPCSLSVWGSAMIPSHKSLEQLYLDYFNNFLSVAAFAEWHGMSEKEAERVIIYGRYHNQREH